MLVTILSCVSFLCGCAHNESLQEKFNTLKDIDYSKFDGMMVVNRYGAYFVTYNGATYEIKRNLLTKKISSIDICFSKGKELSLTKKDVDYIQRALKSFDKMKVLALSVDKKENVSLSLPWQKGCTYYFLKLSPSNTLEDIKKTYYKVYKDKWYVYKECSER